MTTHEEFITMVLAMREAQIEFFETHRAGALAEAKKYETRVDAWLQKHISEKVQLELWVRSVKSSESPGVYDVDRDDKKTEEGEA